ncbi:MAG TPA: response regulator [Rhodocyclaceae bacterium]|nr:response regulator transcription factor [Rhodocyclaceae bacterium]HMV52829.1 response regulator [Rhodocyclaceae bacterium]HMZ82693.1 response regulator [Rhodocyclaceae bacterium]HNA02716.1 response regulator [Rhodocyclaceae bacterium]HNB77374.1 response regulator [Rhodocyclaceae bacterium]
MTAATVYLIDDDDAVRDSVALLLETAGFTVASFSSAESYLESASPDAAGCLVLDLRMGGMDGIALQCALAERGSRLPIIFLSAHGDIPTTVRAIKAGAVDFLTKPVDAGQLIACVREAMHTCESGTDCPPGNGAHGCFDVLTEREREVVGLALDGRSNKEIARVLGISHRTVEFHRSRVLAKTGATSLIQLAAGRIMSPMRPKGDG